MQLVVFYAVQCTSKSLLDANRLFFAHFIAPFCDSHNNFWGLSSGRRESNSLECSSVIFLTFCESSPPWILNFQSSWDGPFVFAELEVFLSWNFNFPVSTFSNFCLEFFLTHIFIKYTRWCFWQAFISWSSLALNCMYVNDIHGSWTRW